MNVLSFFSPFFFFPSVLACSGEWICLVEISLGLVLVSVPDVFCCYVVDFFPVAVSPFLSSYFFLSCLVMPL